VPQLVASLDLDQLIERALEAHREELLELIRRRVGEAIDEFVAEILETQLAGRENGGGRRATPESQSSTRRCSSCGGTFPLDEFHRDRNTPSGRRAACRTCSNLQAAERRQRAQAEETEETSAPFAGSQSTISSDAPPVPASST
jgi:hypothetical protein